MNAITQTFDLVGYVSGLVKLRRSGAYYIGACPICGGRDRFNIKRVEPDLWICRKCSDGKYHDAIDFIKAYLHIGYKEAVKFMGGEVTRPAAISNPPRPLPPAQVIPDSEWQAEAWRHVDEASDRLLNSEEGEAGRRYLTGRGISRGSMHMHLLGYGLVYNRPAIFIPWLDVGDVITAVKYRFIDDNKPKYSYMTGSIQCLFGLQHTLATDDTLLFVEGEFNAVSVLQAMPRSVSVVSAGGDGNGNEALLRTMVKHFSRVMIWMDDPAKAAIVRERMERPTAKIIKSPLIEGVKYDANEMLKVGLLADFLSRQLAVECLGIPALSAQEDSVI